MNTKNQKGSVLVVVTIIIIVGILGLVFFNKGNSVDNEDEMMIIGQEDNEMMEGDEESMMGDLDEMMDDGDEMMEGDEAMMKSESGKYIAYDPALISSAKDGKVVIYFYANWCPTCRLQDADILKEKENIPSDVTILKADYDKETELKKKYAVTSQHTFVQVDAEGNEITKWTGGTSLNGLVAKLK